MLLQDISEPLQTWSTAIYCGQAGHDCCGTVSVSIRTITPEVFFSLTLQYILCYWSVYLSLGCVDSGDGVMNFRYCVLVLIILLCPHIQVALQNFSAGRKVRWREFQLHFHLVLHSHHQQRVAAGQLEECGTCVSCNAHARYLVYLSF